MNLKRILLVVGCIVALGITYLTVIICSEYDNQELKTSTNRY